MFCSKCGTQIADNEAFCTACGAPCSKATANNVNSNVYHVPAPVAAPAPAVAPVAPVYNAQPVKPEHPGKPPIVSVIVELAVLVAAFIMMFTLTFTPSYKYFFGGPFNKGMFGQTAGNFDDMGAYSVFMTIFIVMFVVSVLLSLMPVITGKWRSSFMVATSVTSIALLGWFFLVMLIISDDMTVYVSMAGWIFIVLDIVAAIFSFVTNSKISAYARKKALYDNFAKVQ